MWNYELRSVREKKKALAGKPVVYQYEEIPETLRHQIVHIWQSAASRFQADVWETVYDTYAKLTGIKPAISILDSLNREHFERCVGLLYRLPTEEALDLVQLAFNVIEMNIDQMTRAEKTYALRSLKANVDILNKCFRERGVGFKYEASQIVRVDSEYIHAEVVEPAISLLHDAAFAGPSDEFMKAHEDYRHGRTKDAIREALNAFESTMKAICKARGWQYDETWPAKKLIAKVLEEGLIPVSLQNQFGQFASLMEGLLTVRNKMAGHGQGAEKIDVPSYFAEYALHTAAANIVLLVEAYNGLPKKKKAKAGLAPTS